MYAETPDIVKILNHWNLVLYLDGPKAHVSSVSSLMCRL